MTDPDPEFAREIAQVMRRVARGYDRVAARGDDDALVAFVMQLLGTLGFNLAQNFEGDREGKAQLGKALVEALAQGWVAQMRAEEPEAHASDCAMHNGPALPPGPCDCGVGGRA